MTWDIGLTIIGIVGGTHEEDSVTVSIGARGGQGTIQVPLPQTEGRQLRHLFLERLLVGDAVDCDSCQVPVIDFLEADDLRLCVHCLSDSVASRPPVDGAELVQLRGRVAELEERLLDAGMKVSDWQDAANTRDARVAGLERDCDDLRDQVNARDVEIAQLKEQLEQQPGGDHLQSVARQAAEAQKRNQQLKQQHDKVSDDNAKLRTENTELRAELAKLAERRQATGKPAPTSEANELLDGEPVDLATYCKWCVAAPVQVKAMSRCKRCDARERARKGQKDGPLPPSILKGLKTKARQRREDRIPVYRRGMSVKPLLQRLAGARADNGYKAGGIGISGAAQLIEASPKKVKAWLGVTPIPREYHEPIVQAFAQYLEAEELHAAGLARPAELLDRELKPGKAEDNAWSERDAA